MKFEFKISKLANQFFFISNLSEWHFSCRKEYNQFWLKKTGRLSKNERGALKQFKNIQKKYKFGKIDGKTIYLGTPFIVSQEGRIWENFKKWVNENEFKKIKEIFGILKKRFEIIWLEEGLKLKKFKKFLIREMDSEKNQRILSYLSKFYNKKLPYGKNINIYLFAIPKESSGIGGSALPDKKGITLEVRGLENINDYILVILHEVAHSFLDEDSIKKIQQIMRKYQLPSHKLIRKGGTGLIRELILCSLIPNGYLAEKYFKIPVQKPKGVKMEKSRQNMRFLEKSAVFYLYPLAKKYIDGKKVLDDNYIEKTIKIIIHILK